MSESCTLARKRRVRAGISGGKSQPHTEGKQISKRRRQAKKTSYGKKGESMSE